MYREQTAHESFLRKLEFQQKAIIQLCNKLEIPSIKSGNIVIRDERNYRINECNIDYSWLVNMSRSFVGWGWLFSIKFKENEFRKHKNQEKLIQGLFTINNQNEIQEFHMITKTDNMVDNVREISTYGLFDANHGIALDGVGYDFLVFAPNTEIRISLNNPINWDIWENEIWILGKEIASDSDQENLKLLFE